MTPEQFRAYAPKNLPSHAWPGFPDLDRYPEYRGRAPAWWHWYRLEDFGPGGGRVIEVAGSGGDAEDVWGIRTGRHLQVVRVVAVGTRAAAEAAFRLLTVEESPNACATTKEVDRG